MVNEGLRVLFRRGVDLQPKNAISFENMYFLFASKTIGSKCCHWCSATLNLKLDLLVLEGNHLKRFR